MAGSHKNKAREIVPLNDAWGDFDLGRVNVEELEQRFELSLALPPAALNECKGLCSGCQLATCCSCNNN